MDIYKILIIDDEEDIIDIVAYNLKKEGYIVHSAYNGKEGVELAKKIIPDLILMDVMMPEMDGVEACMLIREQASLQHTLIAFLTARGEDYSQIAGFDAGADDYITKPIKPRVLVSRIKALLRRSGANIPAQSQSTLPIRIDRERYLVLYNGEELSLPRKEFELIALLLSKPGKVFTRERILSEVWGHEVVVGDRTIDVHIRKLREKIGEDFIKTVKGVGYKLEMT
ncbi:MAG: two-component system alkaline phosphatase synthesis response regulator PhoP [Parvicellaceae bacterium]|jgi:two-component system alkaline phosphatase synthesis response regulator PhoP